jgi:CheY-like chemotaxis protein
MENNPEILLIDDEYISNLIVSKYLDAIGKKSYVIKKNGREALDFLSSMEIANFPKFIFVDLRMPIMDGFEFLKIFQEKFKTEGIRIYVLTSSINQSDMTQAREYSVIEGYIQKPINPLHLKEILVEH